MRTRFTNSNYVEYLLATVLMLAIVVLITGCFSWGPKPTPTTEPTSQPAVSEQLVLVEFGYGAVSEGVHWAHDLDELDEDDYQLFLVFDTSVRRVLTSARENQALDLLALSREVRTALKEYRRLHPR